MTRKETITSYENILVKYIPEGTVNTIANWIIDYNFDFKISQTRRTLLGDYRAPFNGQRHKITVNHELNKFSFLITLIHEVAHLTTFLKHKRSIKPHGAEWKQEYQYLLMPFINNQIFPDDISLALKNYIINPSASSCADENLMRVLKKYDKKSEVTMPLEDLPHKSIFKIHKDRYFEKGLQRRKRFACIELKTKSTYLFTPLAEVIPVQNSMFD